MKDCYRFCENKLKKVAQTFLCLSFLCYIYNIEYNIFVFVLLNITLYTSL